MCRLSPQASAWPCSQSLAVYQPGSIATKGLLAVYFDFAEPADTQ